MKPDVVLITPGTLSKSASVHQKQPPAKVAISCFGAVCAKAIPSKAPAPRTADSKTNIARFMLKSFRRTIMARCCSAAPLRSALNSGHDSATFADAATPVDV